MFWVKDTLSLEVTYRVVGQDLARGRCWAVTTQGSKALFWGMLEGFLEEEFLELGLE